MSKIKEKMFGNLLKLACRSPGLLPQTVRTLRLPKSTCYSTANTNAVNEVRVKSLEIPQEEWLFKIPSNAYEKFEDPLLEAKGWHLTAMQRLLKETSMETKNKNKTEMLRIRGPGESAFLIQIKTGNATETKAWLKNSVLKQHMCGFDDVKVQDQFELNGVIVTERMSDSEYRTQMHSKAAGAEKVIKIKGTETLKFVVPPNRVAAAKKRLKSLGYQIKSAGVQHIAVSKVRLGRSDKSVVQKFLSKIHEMPEVVSVSHNLSRGWNRKGSPKSYQASIFP